MRLVEPLAYFEIGPDYRLTPDAGPVAGRPHGMVRQFVIEAQSRCGPTRPLYPYVLLQ